MGSLCSKEEEETRAERRSRTLSNLHDYSTQRLCEFLREEGYGDYCRNFIDHKVTGATFVKLDRKDLEELGVETVGPRNALLQMIGTAAEARANVNAQIPIFSWTERGNNFLCCCICYPRHFYLTRSFIRVTKTKLCCPSEEKDVDIVNLISIGDVHTQKRCCANEVKIHSKSGGETRSTGRGKNTRLEFFASKRTAVMIQRKIAEAKEARDTGQHNFGMDLHPNEQPMSPPNTSGSPSATKEKETGSGKE
eukprot:g1488.t1